MLTPKNDATTAQHGLLPKLGGGTTNFLRADGTWQSPGGGGTPGGSTTQIQYNNAGAFAGDANLTWDNSGTNGMRAQGQPDGTVLDACLSDGSMALHVADVGGVVPYVVFGDASVAHGQTVVFVDDSALSVIMNVKSGSVTIGNALGGGNGTLWVVDDANSKTTSNVKHEMSNGSGTVTIQLDAATGTWTFTLPANDGAAGEVLTTDGSGNTSWTAVSGSGLTSPQVLARSLGA